MTSHKNTTDESLALQLADILKFIGHINRILDEYRSHGETGDQPHIEEWHRRRSEWLAQLSGLLSEYKIRAEWLPMAA